MQIARRIIDLEAPAQRVQAGLGAGKTLASHGDGVDGPRRLDARLADFAELRIQKL